MTLSEFAAHVGIPEDTVFALSYEDCVALLARHGYELTGAGVVPLPPTRRRRGTGPATGSGHDR